MSEKKLKWVMLQPLTGGMYIGTRNAVGHMPECVISYPGFEQPVLDKNGNVKDGGNEYHLIEYLKKKNEMPDYYQFDRAPFQLDDDLNPQLLQNGQPVSTPSFADIDIVTAVPVCAGLSNATSNATQEKKDERNCNMLWLAKYALNTIKPKIYIFENAPTLVSERGAAIRQQLEQIAIAAGYSVVYYKTDTKYHHNCQRRPRTFVYFIKHRNGQPHIPEFRYEHDSLTVEQCLSEITPGSTQQFTVDMGGVTNAVFMYITNKFGDGWRNIVGTGAIMAYIIENGLLDDFGEYIKNAADVSDRVKASVEYHIAHIKDKMAQGLGFYQLTPTIAAGDFMPACMFKTIGTALHHKEDRLYTIREWLHVMGMPDDFEMQGDAKHNAHKIGQNVPARTAQWIVSEAVRIVENWNDDTAADLFGEAQTSNVALFDNTKMKRIY